MFKQGDCVIEFNQFTILKWWTLANQNTQSTVSTTHLKGSRLKVELANYGGKEWCLIWAGLRSEVVATGNENAEEIMFTIITQPTEESVNV